MNYKKTYILIIIFGVIFISLGGTYAYWTWTTSTSQRTEVVFTINEDFRCSGDGGGDITSNDVVLAPADCMNSDLAIYRPINLYPTIYGDGSITMDLWLDIKSIGTGLKNSDNFKYALTTNPNSCTEDVVVTGNFKGKSNGGKVELFNYMVYDATQIDKYHLYIWLDKAETSTSTMNQSFNLSLNGTCTDAPLPDTYVVYNEENTTLRIFKSDENESQVSNTNGINNISTLDNKNNDYNINTVEDLTVDERDKIYFDLENTVYSDASKLPWYSYRESITRVIFEDEIQPISLNNWFKGMSNVEYMDVSNLNTSRITHMGGVYGVGGLFENVGSNVTDSFEIVGLDSWNVSNVINMSFMFAYTGCNATTFDIGDLSNWDVSNVTTTTYMFRDAGKNAQEFNLNLSNWDVSSMTSVKHIFYNAGLNATTWNIGDLSNWDVSNVTNMYGMFEGTGQNITTWNIGDLSGWDTSNVTTMQLMFSNAGVNNKVWDIGDISNWDTSNVTTMYGMFSSAGKGAQEFNIDLSKWDVSNVTSMRSMFYDIGYNATTWNIGDLSNWDVSNVTDMYQMLTGAGCNATTFDIGNLSKWDVSNVTTMGWMFRDAGKNATTWNIGDISNWNTSKVTNVQAMFRDTGKNATTWNIGDLSKKTIVNSDNTTYIAWDVSSVTNMSSMFDNAGYNATTFDIGNLGTWNTSSVTNMSGMFSYSGYIATTWNIGDISNWDTSKVTTMYFMFNKAGNSSTNWHLDLSGWNVSNVTNYLGWIENPKITPPVWNTTS